MIRYSLVENTVTTDPNDYYPQVLIARSVNTEALVERILSMGSTVNKADILAVLEQFYQAVEALVLEGARVNVAGIVDVSPRMRGVFDGITDNYDPARHQVSVTAAPGARLRESIRAKAQVAKEESSKPSPSPLQYADTGTGTTDDILTPGNIGTLNGARLKFDTSKPDEGVYLLPTSGGAAVQITTFQRNKPGQLIFLVPTPLASGDYFIEVRARINNGNELRSGRLESVLTVP